MSEPEPAKAKANKSNKAAEKSDVNNLLGRTGQDRDFLYVAQNKTAFSGESSRMQWDPAAKALRLASSGRSGKGSYTSPLIRCKFPATEFLPSWNISLGDTAAQSFRIFLRVADAGQKLSPWFFMGEGGAADDAAPAKTVARGWGLTHIDYLELHKPAVAFQYKVEFEDKSQDASAAAPALHRFFVNYSGQGKQAAAGPQEKNKPAAGRMVRVKVPYRSQLDVPDEKLRHQICCPTCVSMVLESYGKNYPTMDVCAAAYDSRHKMHGVWPRASQAAFQYGCRSWVSRFRSMEQVRAHLESGSPIIASIRVGEGELRGARYPKSNGHLIVIAGLKRQKVLVNDPYSAGPGGGEIEYEIEDIEKVWLDRGGVAILIECKN